MAHYIYIGTVMNKNKPTKFTFKNNPKETGRSSIGSGTPSINIRYAGIDVGYIAFNNGWNSNRDLGIQIHLMAHLESDDSNKSSFKWVHCSRKFSSSDEAKTYINENFDELSKMIYIKE
jgi:hypothetical protein